MKRTREVLEFETRFESEEFDITAVTGPSGWSADRLGRAEYYTAGVDLLSWRGLEDGELHTGRWRLSCKADEAYYRALQQAAPPDTAIRVRVRRNRMSLLAVSLPQPMDQGKPAPPVDTSAHPVCYRDPKLGAFLLEATPGQYRSELSWRGRPVTFLFAESTAAMMAKATDTVHALLAEAEAWDKLIRGFAASRLLSLAGTVLQPPGEEQLTAAALSARLSLRSVETASRGRFTFRFEDAGLPAGTVVVVEGNLTSGPKRVELTTPAEQAVCTSGASH